MFAVTIILNQRGKIVIMKMSYLAIGIGCLGLAVLNGCDNGAHRRAADTAAKGFPVEVKPEKLSAKTSKGTPLSIYEVTFTVTSRTPDQPSEQKSFAVVVAGNVSGTVEINNSRYAMVQGQKVDMALGSGGAGDVCLIQAKDPSFMTAAILPNVSMKKVLKDAASGKVDLPQAD